MIVDQFHDVAFGALYHQIVKMPALESFVKEGEGPHEEAIRFFEPI